jgi:hypothetical protein
MKSGGYIKVAQMYKQIEASVGDFGLTTLSASTRGIESGTTADDSGYSSMEGQLSSLISQRDALAGHMIGALEGAEFGGTPITQQQAQALVAQGQALLDAAHSL